MNRQPIDRAVPETRPVCPACGHIDGAHLAHCRIAELERVQNAAIGVLWAACDRDWKDEDLFQTANIVANAIYWRDREIANLKAKLKEMRENTSGYADDETAQ